MPTWMIYCDRAYEATRWPFAEWDDFLRAPSAMVNACPDVMRVSPTDGAQEIHAPADLPRPVPRGEYRFAIHHDDAWLYVLLESKDAPIVTPWKKGDGVITSVQLISNDGHAMLNFRGFRQGSGQQPASSPTAFVGHARYGPRQPVIAKREFDWSFSVVKSGERELSCWRIARASITDAVEGSRLRLSISRTNLETIEAVAWGAYHIWGPRLDEFGAVRLVRERDGAAPPNVRRVDLNYDTAAEQGRLVMHWENVRDEIETVTAYHPPGWEAPLNIGSVMVNDDVTKHILAARVETAPIDFVDGHNQIQIACATAKTARFSLEKCSGNRVRSSRFPAVERVGNDAVLQRIRAACATAMDEHDQRIARGEHTKYLVARVYRALGLARFYRYFEKDPRTLAVVRSEADFLLTLQREDGSFAGYHMQSVSGKKPAQPWAGGGYDSGPSGELWVLAGMLTGDEKYLAASRRLLNAWHDYRVEFNHNYAGIGLYHLAAHYLHTGERAALEHALHHAKYSVAVDFLPMGFHGGHNYYSVYGGLTLRGLAMLAAALEPGDPYRAELTELCVRMTNQIITRMQHSGTVDARDRYYIARTLQSHRFWWSFLSVAMLVSPENARQIDAVFSQMERLGGDELGWCDSDVIRYAALREGLLAGRPLTRASIF